MQYKYLKFILLTTILTISRLFLHAIPENLKLEQASSIHFLDSAWIYFEQGKYEKCIQLSKQLIEYYKENHTYTVSKLYNLSGAVYMRIGMLEESIESYNSALQYSPDDQFSTIIFINIATVFRALGDYSRAITFYNKSLSTISSSDLYNCYIIYSNLGLTLFEAGKWNESLKYSLESIKIASGNFDQELGDNYINCAFAYQKLGKYEKAQEYYTLAIKNYDSYYGKNHYKAAMGRIDYAGFLISAGESGKADVMLDKAYQILTGIFDHKHPYLADYFRARGLNAMARGNYRSSLDYFQNALIARIKFFDKTSIYTNPDISKHNDPYLLDLLGLKAEAFEKLASETEQVKNLKASLDVLNIASRLSETLRTGYLSEDSKLKLSARENDLCTSGLRVASQLYSLTGNREYLAFAFSYAERGKYGVLREVRNESKARGHGGIPDSLIQKEKALLKEISGCQMVISNEYQKEKPDEAFLGKLNEKLFDLTRKQEKLIGYFEKEYPAYYRMKYSGEVSTPADLQKFLKPSQALIEYALQDDLIYIFLITRDTFLLGLQKADTSFRSNLAVLNSVLHSPYFPDYNQYSRAAYGLYAKLVMPVEYYLEGKELIIVPDGDLGRISFETFLTTPGKKNPVNLYKDENYLIRKYAVSYAFNATWLTQVKTRNYPFWKRFLAFAPDYYNSPDSLEYIPESMVSAKTFRRKFVLGKTFLAGTATEINFKQQNRFNILNLNMHGVEDTLNPALSRLYFTHSQDTAEDGYLYAYEISNMDLDYNLAAVMACYSGSGNFAEGEGVLNIGRSFANAGPSSVIFSLWVLYTGVANDIMNEFYRDLVRGENKAKALQKARLRYIEKAGTYDASPHTWSGIVLYGSPDPVFKGYSRGILIVLLILAVAITMFVIFRIRKMHKRVL